MQPRAHTRALAPQALQRLSELPFIPTERSRLDLCVRMSTQLHPAIAERLQVRGGGVGV